MNELIKAVNRYTDALNTKYVAAAWYGKATEAHQLSPHHSSLNEANIRGQELIDATKACEAAKEHLDQAKAALVAR